MEAMTPPVDCIGLALDLEQQATLATSQTVERAMLAAAIGLRRIDAHLAQPAQAVDVVAYLAEDTGKPMSRQIVDLHFPTNEDKAKGRLTPLTRALSAQKAGPVGDDTRRLNALVENSWDLRCFPMPTGAGDADIGWRVYEHHSTEPKLREVGVAYCDDPRKAIDAALLPASPTPDKEGEG